MSRTQALVLGGTGAVGQAVLRGLRARQVPAQFTYLSNDAAAGQLRETLGVVGHKLDLRDGAGLRGLLGSIPLPDVVIHCASQRASPPLALLTDAAWDDAIAVQGRSTVQLCQALAPAWAKAGEAHVVLVGALDRTQSLPLPPAFAASQGMLPALAMSLAKELGPQGGRVNVVALGLLADGLGQQLPERLRRDYASFSALKRPGLADEAAQAILWLALDNTYMSGKVLQVNGGI
jgi:3-oxoacyl-[acyl-carrier protein] reductase